MKVKYKITEIRPRIFHVAFQDQYDMCMTFLRAQETYESPNPKFRNKDWCKQEFMRWYSKTYGNGSFTYPNDWGGFNVPSRVCEFVVLDGAEDKDFYDSTFDSIVEKCEDEAYCKYGYGNTVGTNFYLIASLEGDVETLKHEIAHGFWYTIPEYKKEMLSLVKKIKPSLKKKLWEELVKIGYTKQVFNDESQAFMSTGLPEKFGITLKGEDKPFIATFNQYYKLTDLRCRAII